MSSRTPASASEGWRLQRGDVLAEDRRVLHLLATGSKSHVYLAWDEGRRARVAAKLMRPGRSARKLRAEASLLGRLSHPALVRGLEAALDAPRPHLVLEHVEGLSLRRLVRSGPVAPEVVAAVALQMADVLAYLAGKGLVHLDVKPHNILVGARTHTAKLVDAAAIKPVGTLVKGLGATVPEYRDGGAEVAPPAGIWLLGATMWRALSGGSEVFVRDCGEGRTSIRDRARASLDELPDGVPKTMVDLVGACVRADPADRPAAAEVAAGLEPLVRRRSEPDSKAAVR